MNIWYACGHLQSADIGRLYGDGVLVPPCAISNLRCLSLNLKASMCLLGFAPESGASGTFSESGAFGTIPASADMEVGRSKIEEEEE